MPNPMDRLKGAYAHQDSLDLDMPAESDEQVDEIAAIIAAWLKKRRNIKRVMVQTVPKALRNITDAVAKIIILGG